LIAYLDGEIRAHDEEALVLTVGGVGYEVLVSQQTLLVLTGEKRAELEIYTHVREDQLTLFGFRSRAEKALFLSLLKVNGIGPKVAMKILGAAPLDEIIRRIDQGDVRALSQLPKVGRKTAETIVLELKGKLVRFDEQAKSPSAFPARSEIVSALVNLGFRLNDVEKVVSEMEPSVDLEEGVRRGLRGLSV